MSLHSHSFTESNCRAKAIFKDSFNLIHGVGCILFLLILVPSCYRSGLVLTNFFIMGPHIIRVNLFAVLSRSLLLLFSLMSIRPFICFARLLSPALCQFVFVHHCVSSVLCFVSAKHCWMNECCSSSRYSECIQWGISWLIILSSRYCNQNSP